MIPKVITAPFKRAEPEAPKPEAAAPEPIPTPPDWTQAYQEAAMSSAQGAGLTVEEFPPGIDEAPPGLGYFKQNVSSLTDAQTDLVLRSAKTGEIEIGAITETGHHIGSLSHIWTKIAPEGKRAALKTGVLPAISVPGGGKVRALLVVDAEAEARIRRLLNPRPAKRGRKDHPLKRMVAEQYRAWMAAAPKFVKMSPWAQADELFVWVRRRSGFRAPPRKRIDLWIRKGELK